MAESCCNQFGLPKHNWTTHGKHLRVVEKWMCNKADICMGSKICDACRKKLANIPKETPDTACHLPVEYVHEEIVECDSPLRDE